jgi:hypothetical protein
MGGMRWTGVVWTGIVLAGCYAREPHYGNYGARPHEWNLPGPDYERKVFGPMPMGEVKDFVRDMESGGWELVGFEKASLPEDLMVHSTELDVPSAPKARWTPDLPKTMDDRMEGPRKAGIPSYLHENVKDHRQKYLVILRRWL